MSDESKTVPLKRHFISLESKVRILDRLERGEKVSYVAKTLGLNEATIRTIQKSEEKIRSSVAAGCSISANMTARPRAPIIEKMEKALSIWIDECTKQQISLDSNVIKQKALQIYNCLREDGEHPVNPDFVASKGWFGRFKKRFSLHNMRIQEESATADNAAVKTCAKELETIRMIRKNVADLVEIASEMNQSNSQDDSSDEGSAVHNFTLQSIREGINLAEQLELYFLDTDPSIERSAKFREEFGKCLAPYYEIYKDLSRKNRQTKITDFFQKAEHRKLDAVEESSILQHRKRPRLIVLRNNKEEKD